MADTEVYDLGVDETQTPSDLRTVSAGALPAVQAKVDKANRKAKRLGLNVRLHLVVVERRFVKVEDGEAEYEVVDHRIVGDEIVLPGGWRFLAALDHANPEANVVRRAPNVPDEVEVPVWARTAPPACDHCNQDRRRNDTYLVVNDDGAVQQVGSSCLVDFLGLTPAQVGWIFEGVEDGEHDDDDGHGPRQEVVLPVTTFLTVVAHLIRVRGWVSRKVARDYEKVATADDALMVLRPFSAWEKEASKEIFNALTDADEKVAADALAWLTSDDFDVQGDYGWNLRAAFNGSHVSLRNAGIAASLVFCWLKRSEQLAERKAKAAASTSVHVGTVGAKVASLPVTVTGTRAFEGDYGTRLLVKAVTPEGSEIVSWTSPSTAFGAWAQQVAGDGQVYTIKGTVKAHETYNAVAQTVLTRAAVV